MYALIAQLDRVSDYESEGRGFESLSARHKRTYPIRDMSFYIVIGRDSNTEGAQTVKQKAPGERFVGLWCEEGTEMRSIWVDEQGRQRLLSLS